MRGMVINMEEAKLRTLEQIKAFLDGTSEVSFRVPKEGRTNESMGSESMQNQWGQTLQNQWGQTRLIGVK
jgi:hypothetical protein